MINTRMDETLHLIKTLIDQERQAGRINSLDALEQSQCRRESIDRHWAMVQQEIKAIQNARQSLPALPPREQIQWAQTVLALPNVAFMEIDTTGLGEQDEITRFTLVDRDKQVIEDLLIRPMRCVLGNEASHKSGITKKQLEHDGFPIQDVWARIQVALRGHYILSYSQDWDLQQLQKAATTYQLEPLTLIGECIQRRATRYYDEYGLSLAMLCERAGHPLPPHPRQDARDRVAGQVQVVKAIASAVTDLTATTLHHDVITEIPNEENTDLGDLDSHPF